MRSADRKALMCAFLLSVEPFGCTPRTSPQTTSGTTARTTPVRTSAYRIRRLKIRVTLPDSGDRLKVRAGLVLGRLPQASVGGTLRLTLCKGFKGVSAGNIRIADEENKPVLHAVASPVARPTAGPVVRPTAGPAAHAAAGHELILRDPPEVLTVHYDLVPAKGTKALPYAEFAFKATPKMFHVNAAITRADNWYPRVAGGLHRRIPPFELLVDAPRGFEVMASGRLVRVDVRGARTVSRWVNYSGITDRSLYVFGSSERIKVKKVFPDGFTVWMYLPRSTLAASVDRIARIIHKSYRLFERRLGPTGHNEYKIMAFKHGYAGLFNSMCAPTALFTKRIKDNDIGFPSRDLVHEVSHTWWGNVLAFNAEKNYWLFEGFAKFSEITALRQVLGLDVEQKSFGRLKLVSFALLDFAPAVLHAATVEHRRLKVVAAYYMGALFLNLLRAVMGEKPFWSGVRQYVRTFCGRYASTRDFRSVMQTHTPMKLESLFKDYLTKKGFARYATVAEKLQWTAGRAVISYRVDNTADKDIHAPVCIRLSGNKATNTRCRTATIAKGAHQVFTWRFRDTGAIPTVVIDPGNVFPVARRGLAGPGGFLYFDPKNGARFIWVMKDSALARAGIRNGMTLVEVNGKPVTAQTVEQLNGLFVLLRGTVLRVRVKELPAPVAVKFQ